MAGIWELEITSIFPSKPRWDEAEFNRVFEEHYSRMCEVAFRVVFNADEAEDLAGEALWRLWANPPRDRENLSGWLYRVTTRLAYNHLRSNRRRSRYELLAGRDQGQSSAEDVLARRERSMRIRAAFQRMSVRDVQLLALRYNGLSYKEIGAVLNLKPESIGQFLARAEDRFAKLYRKAEENAPEG